MLPQFVTAMKTFTYSVADILDDPLHDGWTEDQIVALIDTWAHEDLGGGEYILIDPDTMEEL
jgi:hypothetical protein